MFNPENYNSVRKPVLEAETLPAHCYTSQSFFDREVERLFAPAWQFVGRVDEVPETGDTVLLDTLAGSTIVVRGSDGQLRAFANSCRHRGTRLKNRAENCSDFVCPYHAWTYALDGSLRVAPGMQGVENFSLDNYSLQPRRLEIWGGFIFIHNQTSGVSLLDSLGDLPDFMRQYRLDELRCVRRVHFDVCSNWKLLIENALEAYHTGIVHRHSLGAQQSEPVDTQGGWDALYVRGAETKSIATMPGEKLAMPFIAGLRGKATRGTWFTVIYPCTQIVFSQDCVWWMELTPLAVDRTRITLGSCFPESTIELADFKQRVAPYYQRWDKATPEDNAIAEAQQRGQGAGISTRGRFSAREHCVHALANWVLDRVLAE